ncbi:YchJ family metal-binding protein [Budvicia diplopodorum]|uniref:YchJ family metal-binding protein n=1 Tax=Budvicia diplopodorum TaxID=1119056 RepID=UPI00135CEE66|nr:YchJ family metal-binding protein [Budvicia diplopodorum]
MFKPCPCGSLKNFTQCCDSLLSGHSVAQTPAELMRSRYSAYVVQNVEYLISSWHVDYRIVNMAQSLSASFEHTEWQGLTIIDEVAGSNDCEGYVEFIAKYQDTKTNIKNVIHERSHFIKQEGRWYYTSGIKPQTGRNDLCPCGGAKKYKKCCGRH